MKMTILLAALAIVESGDLKHPLGNDRAVGKHKEVSRFQVTPKVWMSIKPNKNPTVLKDAEYVATVIIWKRVSQFQAESNRSTTFEDIYALWHRPGLFMHRNWNLKRMPKVVQARCARFAAVCRDLEKKEGK